MLVNLNYSNYFTMYMYIYQVIILYILKENFINNKINFKGINSTIFKIL